MFRTFNKFLSLIAASLMLATVSAKAEVVVASAGPMSGQYASFGAQLKAGAEMWLKHVNNCLLYTSPSPRDRVRSRMPSSA